MDDTKYSLYVLVIAVASLVTLPVGTPTILLIFVAGPLVMFFMLRDGMSGGDEQLAPSGPGEYESRVRLEPEVVRTRPRTDWNQP